MAFPFDLAALKLPRPPWGHQLEEWKESAEQPERFLAWDMGTGKTTTATVWLRLKFRQENAVVKTLIIAPKATHDGWYEDFRRNTPPHVFDKVVIAAQVGKKQMPGKKRIEVILKPENKIVITNYESLGMKDVVGAMKEAGFTAIVCDELHRLKNPTSVRLKGLLTFSDRASYRLGLTGTPILNSQMDVWAQMRFVDRGRRFGTNFFSQFRDKYFIDKNKGMLTGTKAQRLAYFPDWQPLPELAQIVADKMNSISSRKIKAECLTLPPRVVVPIDVELGSEQQRLYDEMEEDLVAEVLAGEATASNALVKILRMRQIICGFMPLDNADDPSEQRIVRFKENPLLDALFEIIEDVKAQGAKIVVWSTFQANYPALRLLCERLKVGFAEFHGQIKDKDAEKKRFMEDPDCIVMLANAKAGGVGVDGFQKVASYCAYFDKTHSAEEYWQSRDRIHRGGSEVHAKITEYHLHAKGTISLDITAALERKENTAEFILERIRLKHGKAKALEGTGYHGREPNEETNPSAPGGRRVHSAS